MANQSRLSPDDVNNIGQDAWARGLGLLSGLGLLLSAVMPWISNARGIGVMPGDMGINQLFSGFGSGKGFFSMVLPLVGAGLLNVVSAFFRNRKAGSTMFGRTNTGGSPYGRRALLTAGSLLAAATAALWIIQMWQAPANNALGLMAGHAQYGAWLGTTAAATGLIATAMSSFGAARSVKLPASGGIARPTA